MSKQTLTVLALSLVGGLMAGAADAPTPKVEVKPAPQGEIRTIPARPTAPPGAARPPMRDRADFLATYLNLTDEQKEKIRPIFAKELEQANELRKETALSVDERRTRYMKIREETSAKLKDILTAEQWEKYSSRGQRPAVATPAAPPAVRPAK